KAILVHFQLCDKYAVCDNSMETFTPNSMNLPKMDDRCLQSSFNKEKCFTKIASGLYAYHIHLLFVQDIYTNEGKVVKDLRISTEQLVDAVKLMVKDYYEVPELDADAQKVLLAKLYSESDWLQKVTARLILRDFTHFMAKTARAIRRIE
uniref:Interleukin-6 n=1 Tax=Latimeria chalumnae TaxID=7897 RepID=H3AI47_LATCH